MTNPVGSLRRTHDGKGMVRMEDLFDTNIDNLWSAITDPARLARWVADVEGDLTLGGRIEARFTSSWTGHGRIDVCDAPRRLLVTMMPGEPDETAIEAWLTEEDAGTRLVVEDRGIPLPELFAHGAGWQAHIEDLAAYLSDHPTSDWKARWTELSPLYADVTIGPAQ
jgi:uncharacterized protein YndB with AHSA1/START domain